MHKITATQLKSRLQGVSGNTQNQNVDSRLLCTNFPRVQNLKQSLKEIMSGWSADFWCRSCLFSLEWTFYIPQKDARWTGNCWKKSCELLRHVQIHQGNLWGLSVATVNNNNSGNLCLTVRIRHCRHRDWSRTSLSSSIRSSIRKSPEDWQLWKKKKKWGSQR